MVKKEFTYKGKKLEELKAMSMKELATIMPSKQRRRLLKRKLTEQQKKILEKMEKGKKTKTHRRDMIILPSMVGKQIQVYTGKAYENVMIEAEMIGHSLGEFAPTRKAIKHSAPGVGASKSSASMSVR
jgi:small subunit ribosomal protein S19